MIPPSDSSSPDDTKLQSDEFVFVDRKYSNASSMGMQSLLFVKMGDLSHMIIKDFITAYLRTHTNVKRFNFISY